MNIIVYNKAEHYPNGWGYGSTNSKDPTRPISAIKTILLHTTNNPNPKSTFAGELKYLMNTNNATAHYLIGQDGRIVQIIPDNYIAWHSGDCKDKYFSNYWSIGIEAHWTPKLGKLPQIIIDGYRDLCKHLMNKYGPLRIDLHRRQAIYPKDHKKAGQLGRKPDPSGWSDEEFDIWYAENFTGKREQKFEVIVDEVNIRHGPAISYGIAGVLTRGDIFITTSIKKDEQEKKLGGIDTWAHVTQCIRNNGQNVSNLGFVHTSCIRKII